MIEVTSFSKYYGSFKAVDSVSFTVKSMRVTGLLGPNGAGKTTIMKAITGCHFASDGIITVEGIPVEQNPVITKRLIGYMPENTAFYNTFKVREYLTFMAEARMIPSKNRAEAVTRSVQSCGLESVYAQPVSSLSKGYRQRLALAQAIIHDPSVVILDEPTVGLDPAQIQEIRKLITELGKTKTVLLSTHIMQEVEAVCSDILILNGGRLAAAGTAANIMAQTKTSHLEDAFLCLTGTTVDN